MSYIKKETGSGANLIFDIVAEREGFAQFGPATIRRWMDSSIITSATML